MGFQKLHDIPVWRKLLRHAKIMDSPEKHLRNLVKDRNRLEKFSLHGANIFYDFSRQRVDERCMDLLFELAETRKLTYRFNCMVSGEKVNITENRAVLHTASRSFSGDPVFVDNIDVMPEIRKVRDDIKEFVSKVHEKKITGSTGKPFKHV
ncbi:MAG: glucose-6-phosphate isomerase, partial [Desulfobacterales bacterium]|nr:glucose-6-phosphate isomerase [Desulfobacterales bacterium]